MFLRISSLCLVLSVAACGAKREDKVANVAPEDRIDCALGGSVDFVKACVIEKAEGSARVIRHEGGGFRRIDVAADGTISSADGSDAAHGRSLRDGRFELMLGSDRYRLPPRK